MKSKGVPRHALSLRNYCADRTGRRHPWRGRGSTASNAGRRRQRVRRPNDAPRPLRRCHPQRLPHPSSEADHHLLRRSRRGRHEGQRLSSFHHSADDGKLSYFSGRRRQCPVQFRRIGTHRRRFRHRRPYGASARPFAKKNCLRHQKLRQRPGHEPPPSCRGH